MVQKKGVEKAFKRISNVRMSHKLKEGRYGSWSHGSTLSRNY